MTAALVSLLTVAIVAVGVMFLRESRAKRRDACVLALLEIFGSASQRAQDAPSDLLVWEPLARTARALFPEAFATLDAGLGGRFPFTRDTIQAAHARWSTEWLSWERVHDDEFRLKAAAIEREIDRLAADEGSEARARLQAIEREKLQRYQDRYAKYVTVSKALAALDDEAAKDQSTSNQRL